MLPKERNIEGICRELKPILGSKADNIWQLYLMEKDSDKKAKIENWLNLLKMRYLKGKVDEDKILLPPPPEYIAKGDFYIGDIYYNGKKFYPFGLRSHELIQHTTIFGRSGAGKTNLGFNIINGLIKKKLPFLVFDWKRNYRDIINEPKAKDIEIFTVGRPIAPFRFNPLIPPPGIPPNVYLPKLIEIISHAYFLGEGVMYILQNALDYVYRKYGVYEGTQKKYPTMHDVLEFLKKYKCAGRESLWLSSTMRAVASLCYGEMGRTLNVDKGIPIEDLLGKQVILELESLSNANKIFIVESLLLWIHHYRMGEKKRESLKHVIMIEEAHHIARREGYTDAKESIIDITVREIREFGEALIMLDQVPCQFSLPALGNSFSTIGFNLKNQQDVKAVADGMLMNLDDSKYLGQLEVGEAIVRLQDRWTKPFLVKIPLNPVKKGSITDEMVKDMMKGCYSAYSIEEYPTEANSEVISPSIDEDKGLSTEEEDFLMDILSNPISSVVERYKRLGISIRKGNEIKDSLIEISIIEPLNISTKKARVVLLQVSGKGTRYLEEKGHKTTKILRYGGLLHEYWKNQIAKHFWEKGYIITPEKPIGKGQTVDILAEKDGKKTVIEIETGKSDAIGNIEKCLKYGFDNIISTHTNWKEMERVKEEMKGKNVKICHVKDF